MVNIFSFTFVSYIITLGEVSAQIFCTFLSWVVCFLIVESQAFFVHCAYKSFIGYAFCEYFLPVHGFGFYHLNSIFHRASVFKFNKLQLVNVLLSWDMLLVLQLIARHQTQSNMDFSPMFSSRCIIVLHYKFRAKIHFELFWGEVKGKISVWAYFKK